MGNVERKTRAEALAEDALVQGRKAEFVGETEDFSKAVNRKIRERYSLSDELAIMRKALAMLGIEYEQLSEYNSYVEQCKAEVRESENRPKVL